MSKETVRRVMRRLRWQRVVIGRARDCVRCSLSKVMLQLEENELWSHRGFCASGKLGRRRELISIKEVQR